ncbi:hypothetical protein ADK55_25100 [Streptomyces sp. WM4235]|nr:hypothetical protein ADK55_25100 [Streptomyces sp. WM4235]
MESIELNRLTRIGTVASDRDTVAGFERAHARPRHLLTSDLTSCQASAQGVVDVIHRQHGQMLCQGPSSWWGGMFLGRSATRGSHALIMVLEFAGAGVLGAGAGGGTAQLLPGRGERAPRRLGPCGGRQRAGRRTRTTRSSLVVQFRPVAYILSVRSRVPQRTPEPVKGAPGVEWCGVPVC